MPLDLLVAELLPAPDAPEPMRAARFPRIERWIARARLTQSPTRSAIDWLAEAYGLASPPPVAAVSLAGEHDAAEASGAWMRADPVHLRIVEDHLEVHDASVLAITRPEAQALIAALQSHFAADRLEWRDAAPERWYLRTPAGSLPRTTPLEAALGRDVFGLLPDRAGSAINWRGAMTEAQMVLSTHAVNEAREKEGKPAVNSIWFWGEGVRPENLARPYALVLADDAFALGLARLSGAEARPLPRSLGEVDLVRPGDRALVVVDALRAPLRRGDLEGWQAAMRSIEEAWFGAMDSAIDRFGAVRLVLPSQRGTCVATLDRAARWRWFRPRRPLHSPHA